MRRPPRRFAPFVAILVALFAAPAFAQGAPAAGPVAAEAARLRAELDREVPGLIHDTRWRAAHWIALARAELSRSDDIVNRPQLVVVVDRNPRVQQMRILLARPDGPWESLGGAKVSTGQRGRVGYFLTPTGVFLHTDLIVDYRAEGTYNEHHIRGLGVKGMRVWDFGWQPARRGWGDTPTRGEIRLLMHSTDPKYLAWRLGRPASKGCVRIPAAMNRFLDRRGILDWDYERVAPEDPKIRAVLLPDRRPTPLAGDMMIVVDSSRPPPIARGD